VQRTRWTKKALLVIGVGLLFVGPAFASNASAPNGAARLSAPTGAAKLSPIKVGQMIPINAGAFSLPESAKAMRAGIKGFNRRGGWHGHPFVLDQCDTMGNGNAALACARKMVADHVVATLGDNVGFEGVNPILAKAGIPRVGLTLITASDFADPIDFSFAPGPDFYYAVGSYGLIKAKKKKIALVGIQSSASGYFNGILTHGIEALGGKVTATVQIAPGTVDYSSYVAAARAGGTNGVLLILTEGEAAAFVRAANQLNVHFTYGMTAGIFSANELKSLGSPAKKGVVFYDLPAPSSSPKTFPALKLFRADMRAAGLSVNSLRGQSMNAWSSIYALSKIMKRAKKLTAKSIVARFNAVKRVKLGGLAPPWTPSKTYPLKAFRHVSQPFGYRMKFNGKTVTTFKRPVNAVKLTYP
jgi:ABC-type branched-subunit amino acid transport system substrate-binding protein